MGSVWIAGSYQGDFARNYAREGLEISDMVAEAVAGTLEAAGVAAEDVAAIHVGNAFGQLFTGQGQLGAMPATVEPRLWGKPGRPARGGLRLGQRGRARGHGRHRGWTLRLRAGHRRGAGAQRTRRAGAQASRRGCLDRPRGPRRQVHVAVHVQPAGQRGQAGDCQVDEARTFATLNIGGSLTTTVSFVVTSE